MRRARTPTRRPLLLLALVMLLALAGGPAVAAAGSTLSPKQAPGDRERLWSNGCIADEERTSPHTCTFGLRSSSFTLALVGDSHASHLFAGFERLARERGWKLVVYTKVTCPFIDIPVYNIFLKRKYTECGTWNANVLAKLKALKPDLTIAVTFRAIHPMDASQDTSEREGAAVGRQLAKVPGRKAVLVDTPYSFTDVPVCLRKHPSAPETCRIPRSQVLTLGVGTRERAAARVAHAKVLDLTSRICGGFPCRVVTDGIVMFRDTHHLTNTYAATLWSGIGKAIDRAFG